MVDILLTQITIAGSIVAQSKIINYRVTDSKDMKFGEARIVFSNEILSDLDIDSDQEVIITRGTTTATDDTIFRGSVVNYNIDGAIVEVLCKDKLYNLSKAVATVTYDKNIDVQAGKISAIAQDLIETYGDLTASVTDSGTDIILDKFPCNNDFILERLDMLRKVLNWQLYYDPSLDKVVFEPKGNSTIATPLQMGVNIVETLVWDYDKENMANVLTIIGDKQEVETTESGQIGVDTGYTTDDILLTEEPVSVKVFSDASDPPTTLLVGGTPNSTQTFDYYVDVSNKKIVWNDTYTPGGSDYFEVRYSFFRTINVTGQDDTSITSHGKKAAVETHKDIKTVEDAITRLNERLAERKKVDVRTQAKVYGVTGITAGKTVSVVDGINNISESLIVDEVVYQFPEPIDIVTVGRNIVTQDDHVANINERLRRLERDLALNQEIVTQVRSFEHNLEVHRRYLEVHHNVVDMTGSFVLGHPDGGVLGTDTLGVTYTTEADQIRLVWPADTVIEDFRDTDFKDSGNANWDTTNRRLAFN